MSYQFKRGVIIFADYEDCENSSMLGIHQLLKIKSEDKIYETTWFVKNCNDLYGIGDKVSFLVSDDLIVSLRLNPFA